MTTRFILFLFLFSLVGAGLFLFFYSLMGNDLWLAVIDVVEYRKSGMEPGNGLPLPIFSIVFLMLVTFLIYGLTRISLTQTSTPDFDSQINPDIDDQDPATNLYKTEETDENENVFDASDSMSKIASQIGSLENAIETTAILRKQKEEIEEDLKKYVNGYNLSIFKIAVTDLIDAYEYLVDAVEELEKSSSPESKEIKQYLAPVSMYIEQGLTAVGIEQFIPDKHVPYKSNPGCDLSGITPTTDKEKEGLIAEVEKAGWRSTLPTDTTQKEILRNSKVSVFKLLEE